MTFTDGYGEQLDRSGTCWSDSNASVIVTVTDAWCVRAGETWQTAVIYGMGLVLL